jgi:hypothetical protein
MPSAGNVAIAIGSSAQWIAQMSDPVAPRRSSKRWERWAGDI